MKTIVHKIYITCESDEPSSPDAPTATNGVGTILGADTEGGKCLIIAPSSVRLMVWFIDEHDMRLQMYQHPYRKVP